MYLLPEPHKIKLLSNYFILKYDTKIIVNSELGFKEINYAKILKKQIEDSLSFSLDITKADIGEESSITLQITEELKPEEYKLSIKEDRIEILGGNSNGILYGVQTLRQIISQKGAVLPCLMIDDYPEISNRGFYHDATRGRIPTLVSLKALADKMSYYKLNQLQLYIEHSFLFRDFSEVWRDDTPITAEEIIELDEYCLSINIELVPSIASFGHLHKVLSTKTYSSLCELEDSDKDDFSYMGRMEHHTVDITNDKSFEMIKKMLLEFLPLFSSGQFNLCADETFDLGKGKSKSLGDEVGMDRMYVDFLKKLCEFIKEQGKRSMFWGDIIAAKPEAIKELPEDVTCLNWDYSANAQGTNAKKLHDIGVTQYLCPGVHGWRRLINRIDYAYANIAAMCGYAHKYQVAGFLTTDWGDYGHINHPEFSTTGMIYGASFSWNVKQLAFTEINQQISVLEYRDITGSFVQIINEMGCQDAFLWESAVQYKETSTKTISNKLMDEFFGRFHLEHAREQNEKLAVAIDDMYKTMSTMDSSKRSVVKAYLVMAKGMMLLNTLGATVGQYKHQVESPLATDPTKLAVDLEYWFKDYKELWRSISKEGELYRIQNIIFWYADLLRDLAK